MKIIMIAALFLSYLPAQAALVSISGQGAVDGTWEVTLVEGSFIDLESELTSQIWWGEDNLALLFATELGDIGVTQTHWGEWEYGPWFAYDRRPKKAGGGILDFAALSVDRSTFLYDGCDLPAPKTGADFLCPADAIFATAAFVGAVPIPAAIWLFGTALIGLVGFGKRKAGIAA